MTENQPLWTKSEAIAPEWSKVGIADMSLLTRSIFTAVLAAPLFISAAPAEAGIGDLLVAPTRIVLDGRKGAEVVLNNIGEEPAVYRISVEFRRMDENGGLNEVSQPTADDQKAADMIIYAPRRVTLAPHEPQAIRIAARPPQGLPDGEYRIHLLFRAIPPATPVVQAAASAPEKGLRFQLTPVYGVTIPVIVRLGNLQATAGIANVHLDKKDGDSVVSVDLSRSGTRSTFGEVRVLKAGVKDPIALQKGVAVYTEVKSRKVLLPVSPAYK
ncbi:MAG: fimbria/pilus periplasmic chaperone, partial [Actinobacteria bacterium]|nr:fimbria/pilus periplasmic chaperone [Actinomycetota bacterium]